MRSGTDIDGVLLVDKSQAMTSHDVVAITRRSLNTKKVGHCGTLDPLATGLLIITIGRGTKIQDLLMSEDKEYVGTLKLGEETDSQDSDGQVTKSSPVPEFTREQINAAFAKFHGDFYQTPPMVTEQSATMVIDDMTTQLYGKHHLFETDFLSRREVRRPSRGRR
jgi:tRNA pseudouridine55 synthase